MRLQPSYLLHETCDIVNFLVDDEPCVFAHVMGLNLLEWVTFHAAVLLRRARAVLLHVLVLSSHRALSLFPHIHAASVASLLELSGNQCLGFISNVLARSCFLIHLTCPAQFLSSRHTISPPVTRMTQSIHSNRTSQSALSSRGTRPVTDPAAANQNQEQIITRPPNVTRMLRAHWSHVHVTQPQKSLIPFCLRVYSFVIGLMYLSLFCDWIYVFINCILSVYLQA